MKTGRRRTAQAASLPFIILSMKCPTCGQPANRQDNPHRPFCSERCKLIDFGKWANEEYVVPGQTRLRAENQENTGGPETETES